MKAYKLSAETRAATGWTHAFHFKAADGDLATAAEVADLMTLPIGSFVGTAAFHVVTAWNTLSSPAVDCGVAATATGDDTLLDGGSLGTAGQTVYGGTNAVHFKINNTASRFLTIKQVGTGSDATAGEGWLFVRVVQVGTLVGDPAVL